MAHKGRVIVINQLPGGSEHIFRVGGHQVGKTFKTPDQGKAEAGRLQQLPETHLSDEEKDRAVQLCSRWADEIQHRSRTMVSHRRALAATT